MTALNISALREMAPRIVALGSSKGIIQSILDFDYLAGRTSPSIVAVVATGRKSERYFFGPGEIVIPVYSSVEKLPENARKNTNLFLNLSSGRRVLSSSLAAIKMFPALVGGVIFAEGLPERHAIELAQTASKAGVWLA